MNRRHPDRHPLRHDPARSKGRVRGVLSTALAAALLTLATFAGWASPAAADNQPTLRIDAPSQTIAPGQEVVVSVVLSATVATTGAQVTVNFDQKLLQLKDFEIGPAYTSKSAILAFGNADFGTSNNKGATIQRANKVGLLENAAAFLLPGSGVIDAGDNVFLKVTFVALPGPGAHLTLGLTRASSIDEAGDPLVPITVNAPLVIGPGKGPAGSGSPGGSEPTSPEPSQTAAESPPAPVSPTTPVAVSIAPTSLTLNAGNTARIFLIANSDGDVSSVAADLTFDNTKLEFTGIEAGPAWDGATIIASSTNASAGVTGAIAEANTAGILKAAGAFFPPGTQDLPYGEGAVVSFLVKAKADGTSSLSVGNATVLGVSGEAVPATIDTASQTKPPDKGLALDPTLAIPVAVLALIVLGGALAIRSGRIPVRVRRRWPYFFALALGLIPVVAFVGLVLVVVVNSAPVVFPGLLGAQEARRFATQGVSILSVVPALWGSVLIALVAVIVALPISLALAIVAVDFPMGPITRLVRPLVGILSGIPPIVYAVSVPIFISVLMIPKFAANANFSTFDPAAVGADPATWPPADVPYSPGGFSWDLSTASSTLLGGLLIALFLVPFVTPLFVDALRDVPRAAREASLALGANLTYTLRRVVLPRALPAIIGASMLAVLKAFGDTLIVGFAAGWTADQFPTPLFDILERTSSLAAFGTGKILSLETLGASCTPANCALGYSSALLLLLLAAVVVIFISWLQGRGRRRVAV